MPFLSYGRVDSGSIVRGLAVGLWLGAIVTKVLLVVDTLVWSIVVVVVVV